MSNAFLPIILVRGFDPLGDVAETTYYGFNDGTVYPHKMADDYIYEGMLLKFLKTDFLRVDEPGNLEETRYQDATNALRYALYRSENQTPPCVEADPVVSRRYQLQQATLWVYRYYDFKNRDIPFYAEQLKKVIEQVKAITGAPQVNLICHSMGGVVARWLIQKIYGKAESAQNINKWVTLGTPHRGIAFQALPNLDLWELEYFNREVLENSFGTPLGKIEDYFDPNRILCIVGTNHSTYGVQIATLLNQFASWLKGQDQNHSDGLVKQESATLIGAHRADVFKCHGGKDSLVTSREAFELATRFFFGDWKISVFVESAEISKGYAGSSLMDKIGSFFEGDPEFYIGFSVKPRQMDFYLHQQDAASENCFGPLSKYRLNPTDFVLDTEDSRAERKGLVFQGFLNSALIPKGREDMVFRFDTYVGERDPSLLGHTDTLIANVQSYFQYVPGQEEEGPTLQFYPRQKSEPIVCESIGANDFRLSLDFGDMAQFFKMDLRITVEPAE